jgi:pimeloyl-ACP methyl ester carboxylesterase
MEHMKPIFFHLLIFASLISFGQQDTKGNFIQDKKNKCTVWFKNGFPEDSVSWSGGCKDGLASGEGIMTGYVKGNPSSKYVGKMENGKPNGNGVFTFAGNLKLEGNFSNGEILNLRPDCLLHLHKQVVFNSDSADYYIRDNAEKKLYYHAIVPEGKIKGAIVLLPGTWETTEHLISSNQKLCELAYDKSIAVIVPSINQRLTMTPEVVNILNAFLTNAIKQYGIPKDKFIIGGWSMGGLFSLRYTELAKENSSATAITPIAVFSCDGPCDLENVYGNFQKKAAKFPGAFEPTYGLKELETFCGGTPLQVPKKYIYFSCYSHSQADGGNAKFLKDTPVRIYDDVDPNWWMANRDVDMYDMNALDQSAMIILLRDAGNKNAEFINAFGKGYRIEGNRHPHSWSIVEPADTIKWISKYIN